MDRKTAADIIDLCIKQSHEWEAMLERAEHETSERERKLLVSEIATLLGQPIFSIISMVGVQYPELLPPSFR